MLKTADPLDTFAEHRGYLFSIAYRMLGSASDAEDMVQETFLRWHRTDHGQVQSPRAWLSTVVTRLCITELESARHQREKYIGPWLPEPIVTSRTGADRDNERLAESLSMAFLVVLESLAPAERAVFLLRDVFAYEFDEISRIVEKSEVNCRKLLSRARESVAARKPRFEPLPEQAELLLNEFLDALESGNLESLLALLSEEVSVITDGGGLTTASRRTIEGADRVSRFLIGAARKFGIGKRSYQFTNINHQPGFIGFRGGKAVQVGVFEIAADRIRTIRFINNPQKLGHLTPQEGD